MAILCKTGFGQAARQPYLVTAVASCLATAVSPGAESPYCMVRTVRTDWTRSQEICLSLLKKSLWSAGSRFA